MTEFGAVSSASQTPGQQILVNSSGAGQQTFLISGPNGKVQTARRMIPVSTATSQPQQTVLITNGALTGSSSDGTNTVVYQPVTVDQTGGHTGATSVFPASLIQQLLQQSSQQSQTSTISVPTQNGNVIMLVQNNGTATPIQLSQPLTTQSQIQIQNGVVSNNPTTTTNTIASTQALPAADVEEEPLYVNAKQYHRILKRRQDRARLEAQGKIPKERRRYLHESRHRHAMNRVRGEGGRFHARDEKETDANGTEESAEGQQCLNEYFSQIPST
ncbi:nuclear transcription factor Y subunit alpha [Galendromus occidentalis]|uniref:Nuclear transcription factor Y subunit n=1 Tax=Galendromus occidentalis TaxID=34638 RepID=A0AAJ6QMW0_9ACAR|nr:nuclear transcription factor Y subunit alpha [Galendromus occidentalis]